MCIRDSFDPLVVAGCPDQAGSASVEGIPLMARRLPPVVTLTASAAIVGLALSACGSNSLSTPTTSASAPAASQSADSALVAKLPAKVKSAGQIVVGVDATYSPDEFLNADGKTVQGWDVDLFNAVMQKFGIKVLWQPAGFDTIIAGRLPQDLDPELLHDGVEKVDIPALDGLAVGVQELVGRVGCVHAHHCLLYTSPS